MIFWHISSPNSFSQHCWEIKHCSHFLILRDLLLHILSMINVLQRVSVQKDLSILFVSYFREGCLKGLISPKHSWRKPPHRIGFFEHAWSTSHKMWFRIFLGNWDISDSKIWADKYFWNISSKMLSHYFSSISLKNDIQYCSGGRSMTISGRQIRRSIIGAKYCLCDSDFFQNIFAKFPGGCSQIAHPNPSCGSLPKDRSIYWMKAFKKSVNFF